ncbi:hypothetical protein D3C80_2200300 [compost metagenome]
MAVGTVALGAGAIEGQRAGYRFAAAVTDENAQQQGLQISKGNLRNRSVGVCGHL